VIHYRIHAPVSQRVAQFRELTSYLASIGFVKDPGPVTEPEDSDEVYMTGIIAARDAAKILAGAHVQAILLVPKDFRLPSEDQRVKVELTLVRVATPPRQRLLADQVRVQLTEEGFRESIGYDNRGQTRIVGTMPARDLRRLLEDLRWQDSGWLAPQTPVQQLPEPLRDTWPVDIVKVLPQINVEQGAIPAQSAEQGAQDVALNKISPALRAQIGRAQSARIEVVVGGTANGEMPAWTQNLEVLVPGAFIEGQAGPLFSIRARTDLAPALARLPDVVNVRLPRPADPESLIGEGVAENQPLLQKTGLARLHAQGARGQGTRIGIIATDFRGFEKFVGRQLPKDLQWLDLTAECNPNLEPSPSTAGSDPVGHGTRCALAAALAAPSARLVLIRVDPDAPFQLLQIARYAQGEIFSTGCLEERNRELMAEGKRLEQAQDRLLEERKLILDSFGQDAESVKRRETLFKNQEELTKQVRKLEARQDRYFKLLADLQGLKNLQIAASTLVWSDGYPVNGDSGLSRSLDDQPPCRTIWFQSAGNTRGQTWTGQFRDFDGNGVMEFAPPVARALPGRWTTELNFLGWLDPGSKPTQELPAGKLRVSVQWSEPHEIGVNPDLYQPSLVNLRLLILRQRDPSGTKLPTDDLELIAASAGLPERLTQSPNLGIYCQNVEFTVSQPGRYAVRLEGRVPATLRPSPLPTLPGQAVHWELWPRLLVEARGETAGGAARPIFFDYATDLGNLGMPADARHVASVGAVNLAGVRQPYSAGGPPAGQRLHAKPELLSFDQLRLALGGIAQSQGTGIATSFAAGAASSLLSAGSPPVSIRNQLFAKPGRTWP
jgi:hypothetical protein